MSFLNNFEIKSETFPVHRNWGFHLDNGLGISIAVGQMAYCSPKRVLSSLDQYESVEVAVLRNGEYIDVSKSGAPYRHQYDSVLPYLDIKEFEDIFNALSTLTSEQVQELKAF